MAVGHSGLPVIFPEEHKKLVRAARRAHEDYLLCSDWHLPKGAVGWMASRGNPRKQELHEIWQKAEADLRAFLGKWQGGLVP